jgi:hypothetical protein
VHHNCGGLELSDLDWTIVAVSKVERPLGLGVAGALLVLYCLSIVYKTAAFQIVQGFIFTHEADRETDRPVRSRGLPTHNSQQSPIQLVATVQTCAAASAHLPSPVPPSLDELVSGAGEGGGCDLSLAVFVANGGLVGTHHGWARGRGRGRGRRGGWSRSS